MTGQQILDAINASNLEPEVRGQILAALNGAAVQSVQLDALTAAYDNLAGAVNESRSVLATAYSSARSIGNPMTGVQLDVQAAARKNLASAVANSATAEQVAALALDVAIAFI